MNQLEIIVALKMEIKIKSELLAVRMQHQMNGHGLQYYLMVDDNFAVVL